MREVHVYLSDDLDCVSSPIAAALPEIRARLLDNHSELVTFSSATPGLIRFKRHVQARYDEASKRWVALEQDVWEWETTVVIVSTAEEIVDHALTDRLSDWIGDLRLQLGNGQMILLIKDLGKYHAKSKTLANREFAAAVRGSSVQSTARLSRLEVDEALAHRCFLVYGMSS